MSDPAAALAEFVTYVETHLSGDEKVGAVEENGYTVDLEAKEHDIPGLVAAVLKLGKG
ncbi:MAG: hypothetical protein IT576_07500 [Verrucomicrobiales bacterium]|nr:hypothetical protein [Verrucomicrobiales bacterium]